MTTSPCDLGAVQVVIASQTTSFQRCYGPENVSAALQIWASRRGIGLEYIQSGKPQQNAYVERYNRTVRHEWLGQYIFETIEEAQDHATRWLCTYNNERSNRAISGATPAMKLKTAASSPVLKPTKNGRTTNPLWLAMLLLSGLQQPLPLLTENETRKDAGNIGSGVDVDAVGTHIDFVLRCMAVDDACAEAACVVEKFLPDPKAVFFTLSIKRNARTDACVDESVAVTHVHDL